MKDEREEGLETAQQPFLALSIHDRQEIIQPNDEDARQEGCGARSP
jgi:hypothetical protein